MLPPCLEFGDERQRVKGSPLADALYPSILLTILGVNDEGNSSAPRQEPLNRNLTVLPHRSCDYPHTVGVRGLRPRNPTSSLATPNGSPPHLTASCGTAELGRKAAGPT